MSSFSFDIRTLSFVTVFFSFGLGIGLISFSLIQKSFAGLKSVGFGFTCIGLGFMLIGLRDYIPDTLSVITANTLLAAGFALMNSGIQRFTHQSRTSFRTSAVLLVAVLSIFIYFTYFNPNILLRVFSISIVLTIFAGMCCKSILFAPASYQKVSRWLITVGFTLFGGFMIFRAFWVVQEIQMQSFMKAGNIHGLAFLAAILLLLSVSFGLFWMANAYLQNGLQQYERIISATPDIVMLTDENGVYRLVNEACLKRLDKRREDILGKRSAELFGQEIYESVTQPNLKKVFNGKTSYTTTWLDLPTEGKRYMAITYHPVPDLEGHIRFAAINARDITDLYLAKQEKERIFMFSLDLLCVAGMDGYFKEVNPAWTNTLGWSKEELLASPWTDFVHPEDVQATIEAGAALVKGEPVVNFVNRYRTKNGSYIHISWASYPDIVSQMIFAVARDISDRIRLEEELKNLANLDPLTGTDNRRSFMRRLSDEINRSLRYNTALSIFMMDVDHFKSINDTFGHQVGDKVLQELVASTKKMLRATDVLGRLGGEEFAAFLPHTPIKAGLETAERLRIELSKSEMITEAGPLKYTISIGVTELWPDQNEPITTLLKRADDALYRAKNSGRNRVEKA